MMEELKVRSLPVSKVPGTAGGTPALFEHNKGSGPSYRGPGNGFQGHSERVAEISRLGERLGLDKDEAGDLYYSALLHDIEKSACRLCQSREQNLWACSPGAGLLEGIAGWERVRQGILYHHERYMAPEAGRLSYGYSLYS